MLYKKRCDLQKIPRKNIDFFSVGFKGNKKYIIAHSDRNTCFFKIQTVSTRDDDSNFKKKKKNKKTLQ